MIRFAWLQSRTQTLIGAGVLAVLAIVATITGIQLSHLYTSLVAHCQASCDLATSRFLSDDNFFDHLLDILARAVPALVGMFWGAPLLAHEFETGTHRLAWTQSVPRSRWQLSKSGVGALVALLLSGLFSLTVTWWYRSRDKAGTTAWSVFDRRDIVPVAYTLFAFAVGVLLGAIIRRTVPAMAATLGTFVFVRIAISLWVRPYLLAAKHVTLSLANAGPNSQAGLGIGFRNGGALQLFAKGSGPANSWTLSSHLVTTSGHRVTSGQMTAFLHQYCSNIPLPPIESGQPISKAAGADPGQACLDAAARTFHLSVTYQPANHYWPTQWLESGVFVALAAAAIAGSFWWVQRRN
jgi:ABC-type transport system involved in multi-copper enzyme maturation permease subunit